eukprot:2019491-Prymnesium_polylepis.1
MLEPSSPAACPLAGWSAFGLVLSRRPLGSGHADTLAPHVAIPRVASSSSLTGAPGSVLTPRVRR